MHISVDIVLISTV